MPALVSPAKRAKTSHRTPVASALVATQPDPPPTPLRPTRHRLFVGGCPLDLTPPQLHDELQRRFSSFGRVTAVDVIAGSGGCKGFAYVELETDRLPVVLSTFRGSKWRGHWFRVEQAQADYLTRLKQQWTTDTAAEQQTPPPPAEQQMDWEGHVYCFRVRPGVRVRIPHQTSVKQFATVQPLPLDQLSNEVAEESGVGEVETREVESEEAFRRRLQQSKEEVERIWLPHNTTPHHPPAEQLTKKQRVALKRREREAREQEAKQVDEQEGEWEEEAPVAEVASEEELGVVDFDAERENSEDERAEEAKLDGMTKEERLKWQEEKEWAMLEDGGGDWVDEQVRLDEEQDGQRDDETKQDVHELPEPRNGAPAEISLPNEVEEWAALEDGTVTERAIREETEETSDTDYEANVDVVESEDEVDDEQDSSTKPSHVSTVDQPSFPKLSAADWFDDDSQPPSSPSTSMEQRMRALSSRLVASQGEFNVRPAYEGASGQQLLRLKQTYKGDERFAVDNRFAAAAVDQHRAAQAEEQQVEAAVEQVEVEAVDGEREFKRQLHAETVRALQVLDAVAPGPTPFHTTLPRFSHSIDKREADSGASEVEKDAATIEAELNESEMRKSVTMWRKINRYDPDKDDALREKKVRERARDSQDEAGTEEVGQGERVRPESKAEKKRRLRQERQHRQRQQREQAAAVQPRWSTADSEEMDDQTSDSQQQPPQGAGALYELGVSRLRDLITDRSTVVQFSFAFDSTAAAAATGESSVASTEAESDVAMNVYAPMPEVFPTRPAPVAVQPPAAVVQPIAGAVLAKRANTLHNTVQQCDEPGQPNTRATAHRPTPANGGAGRLSDLLALAQQAHSVERSADKTTRAPAADSSDDEEDKGVFMRQTAEGDMENEWRQRRTNIREDYKRKNRLAVRQESNKQVRGGATLPWMRSKENTSAERDDGRRKGSRAAL